MKKFALMLVSAFTFIFVAPNTSSATPNSLTLEMKFNNNVYELEEGQNFIFSDDHILIAPGYLSDVFPFLIPGKGLWWDNETKTMTFTYIDQEDYIRPRVTFKIGDYYFHDFEEQISIRATAKLVDGRAYFPLRAVSEAYGKEVIWENENGKKKIVIRNKF